MHNLPNNYAYIVDYWSEVKNNKVLLSISLAVSILAAIFTVGYNNPDEHWQINEFAAYKLGLSSAEDMPWELHRQSRQTIQPAMVYVVSKAAMALGIFNPFGVALFLRILSVICAFAATNLLIFQAKPLFAKNWMYTWCLAAGNLLWFVPYIHARFQSENWSGIALTFAVFLWLKYINLPHKWLPFTLAGLLMGLAFNFRFQSAFAIAGIAIWTLIFKKEKIYAVLILAIGFFAAIAIAFYIDYWYYGTPIFMPYKYFQVQIVENVVNNWEVYPWWYFTVLFFIHVVPPLSIVLLVAFAMGSIKNYKFVYVWATLFFLAGHSWVGHKEIRFLLPVFSFFIITCGLALNQSFIQKFISTHSKKIFFKVVIYTLVFQNALLLIATTLKPANEIAGLLSHIYKQSSQGATLLLYKDTNPYEWGTLHYNFYKNPNTTIAPIDSVKTETFSHYSKVLFAEKDFELKYVRKGITYRLTYKTIPDWLRNFNFNNWLSRARVWSVYEVIIPDYKVNTP